MIQIRKRIGNGTPSNDGKIAAREAVITVALMRPHVEIADRDSLRCLQRNWVRVFRAFDQKVFEKKLALTT